MMYKALKAEWARNKNHLVPTISTAWFLNCYDKKYSLSAIAFRHTSLSEYEYPCLVITYLHIVYPLNTRKVIKTEHHPVSATVIGRTHLMLVLDKQDVSVYIYIYIIRVRLVFDTRRFQCRSVWPCVSWSPFQGAFVHRVLRRIDRSGRRYIGTLFTVQCHPHARGATWKQPSSAHSSIGNTRSRHSI